MAQVYWRARRFPDSLVPGNDLLCPSLQIDVGCIHVNGFADAVHIFPATPEVSLLLRSARVNQSLAQLLRDSVADGLAGSPFPHSV